MTLPFGVRVRVVGGARAAADHRGGGRSVSHAHSPDRHLRHGDGDARRDAEAQGSRRPRIRSGRLSADERLPRGRRDPDAQPATAPEHITADLDLVVVGNAISRGNAELEEVLDRKIRYCSLPEAIREHFLWGARSIVIAGTHGKTTTTSLTGWLLTHGGLDPSVLDRRHRAEFRRARVELSDRAGARLRHRRRRVRQRVLRQDREVPQVPARHRRHQQRRVRSRRHLRRLRRGDAGVPAAGEPGAAARSAADRRGQPGARARWRRAAVSRVADLRHRRRCRLAGARPRAAGASTRFSVRRGGSPFGDFEVPLRRRAQRAQRPRGDRGRGRGR